MINKDTKKLNAGIAILALGYLDTDCQLDEGQFLQVSSLCERLGNTSLYGDGQENNPMAFQHAINMIEEYLEEEGV